MTEYISPETQAILEQLVDLTVTGRVIGIAFVALESQQRISLGWAGEVDRNPLFAIGGVARLTRALQDHAEEIGY